MYSLIRLATLYTLSSFALADCFFPNGNTVPSDTACNPNAIVSSCCFDGQACLSNGLCVSDPHNQSLARTHRGTCTDKAWKSGNCPRQCLDLDDSGADVFSCNQTGTDSYCCGVNCKCNNDNFETFSFPDNDVYTLTIIGEDFTNTHTATSSATASVSATNTGVASSSASTTGSPNTASSTNGEDDESSSSNTTAIGVGVGVGVGALLLGAAAFFFWRRKKRNDTGPAYAGTPKELAEVDNTEYYPPPQKYAYFAEESSQRAPSSAAPLSAAPTELPSGTVPVELPASPSPRPEPTKKSAGFH